MVTCPNVTCYLKVTLMPPLDKLNLVPEQPTMKTIPCHVDIFHLSFKKVKYTFCWKVFGFPFDLGSPRICHVLSTPLMGATLFLFYCQIVSLTDVWTFVCNLWMSERAVSLVDWNPGWILVYMCFTGSCLSFLLFFCPSNVCPLSLLSLSMHIFTCWINNSNCRDNCALRSVKNFPVHLSFCIFFSAIHQLIIYGAKSKINMAFCIWMPPKHTKQFKF